MRRPTHLDFLTLLLATAAACRSAPEPVREAAPRGELPLAPGVVLEEPLAAAAHGRLVGGSVQVAPPRIQLEGAAGAFTSRTIERAVPFDDLLASWNVDCPEGAGFVVELQVGRGGGDGSDGPVAWSPWLHIGDWGPAPPRTERVTRFEGGEVDVDVFRSDEQWTHARYRIRGTAGEAGDPIAVARFVLCFSQERHGERVAAAAADWSPTPVDLAVPARSQKLADPEIASRICSPTSVAMVLAWNGVDAPTGEVAARAFDASHDIYGNWPRAVQTAWTYGVPGYLARFQRWVHVEAQLAARLPLVASIRAEEGELAGAPYPRTSGHLLVITGFDGEGNVLVNDPASPDLAGVRRAYSRRDLERVWFANGGLAYVLGTPRW